MAGYKYFWTCPKCGTNLQLKMRVTQTKRKCPQCGFVVTPEEIDNQKWFGILGGFIIVGLIWVLCAIPTGSISNFLYGLAQAVIGIIVIAVIAFAVYIGYQVYKDQALDTKKNEFLNSADFQLVRDYARSELRHENGSDAKLLSILQNKGWNFAPQQIKTFIEEELQTQLNAEKSAKMAEQSAEIADQIKAKNPNDRNAYLKAYIEVTHPQEEAYLHVIAAFLNVPESDYPKLNNELVNLTEKIELEEFERKLQNRNAI